MFLRFPTARPPDAEAVAAAYALDLERFPLWAIDAAIGKVIHAGSGFNPAFVPTSPQLQELCSQAVAPFQDEALKISHVLGASVYHERPATERERVIAGFNKLLADIRGHADMNQDFRVTRDARDRPSALQQKAEAERKLAELQAGAGSNPPPKLSESALKSLSLIRSEEVA